MKQEPLRSLSISELSDETAPHPSRWMDRWALTRIQEHVAPAPLRFVLWDGYERACASGPPVATVIVRNRTALYRWLWDPELNFGEGYMSGAVEVHGSLIGLLEEVYRALGPSTPRSWWRRAVQNTEGSARANVHHHYDLGNEFYRLWLDREMLYTCAYFPTPDASLEDAQLAKMSLVCRKLRLQPGERVIEAGCGWGALALHMARHHGVRVRAFNISTEQIAWARARAKAEGLDRLVEFIEDDYRHVQGECDAFVSVGMLEHVGLPDYPALSNVMHRTLATNGRGLLHFIGRNRPEPLNPWIRKRIFPGAYPPTLSEVFNHVLQPHLFSVLDVENLRLHYAKTLEHWRVRFEDAAPRVAAMFDEPFVRAWRLYLTGAEVAFTTGSMQLFQVVFSRGSNNVIPWTRVSG